MTKFVEISFLKKKIKKNYSEFFTFYSPVFQKTAFANSIVREM